MEVYRAGNAPDQQILEELASRGSTNPDYKTFGAPLSVADIYTAIGLILRQDEIDSLRKQADDLEFHASGADFLKQHVLSARK